MSVNLVCNSKKKKSGYTLVEILVVLGVVSVILGIGLTAFTKMGKGHAVEYAAQNIASKLKLARSYAISERKIVALVIPEAAATYVPTEYKTKMRACVVTGTPGDWTFQRWINGENWTDLPVGSGVTNISNQDTIKSVNNTDIPGGSTGNLRGIIFKPNGLPSNQHVVTLNEGAVSGTSFTITNTANVAYVYADQYTGRVSYGQN
jgi:prepilin-type N-terminal cleavage/methylation domain-containing protein